MSSRLEKLAEAFFLTAVILLIVRKNTYPWPLKRASDLLILFSFLTAAISVVRKRSWSEIRALFTKEIRWGFGLIALGLTIATFYGAYALNRPLDSDLLLTVGRFVETGVIVLLAGFFQNRDSAFRTRALRAFMGTLVYLVIFVMPPGAYADMYRFQLFENWPSNVAYYLLVSFNLALVWSLVAWQSKKMVKGTLCTLAGIGLAAIFLWTQSRAAYLAFTLGAGFFILVWAGTQKHKIRHALAAGCTLALVMTFGFSILKPNFQDDILIRLFPNLRSYLVVNEGDTTVSRTKKGGDTTISRRTLFREAELNLYEPSRPFLWRAYGVRALAHPWGEGLRYEPVVYENFARGPHATPLELVMYGGLPTLAGFLVLAWGSMRNAWKAWCTDDNLTTLALLVITGELLFVSLFDNMSTFRMLYLILGLAYFVKTCTSPQEPAAAGRATLRARGNQATQQEKYRL